jgi:hypothetical protein
VKWICGKVKTRNPSQDFDLASARARPRAHALLFPHTEVSAGSMPKRSYLQVACSDSDSDSDDGNTPLGNAKSSFEPKPHDDPEKIKEVKHAWWL